MAYGIRYADHIITADGRVYRRGLRGVWTRLRKRAAAAMVKAAEAAVDMKTRKRAIARS